MDRTGLTMRALHLARKTKKPLPKKKDAPATDVKDVKENTEAAKKANAELKKIEKKDTRTASSSRWETASKLLMRMKADGIY